MARAWASVVVVVAFALFVVALAGADTATPSATPRCTTPQLVVWLTPSEGGGAAGSFFYRLNFTNLTARACTLTGYPGVSAVGLDRRRLGTAAGRNPQRQPRIVTLRAGDTATAVLQISQAANFPASTYRQTTAAGRRVYPPSAFNSKIVPFPFSACSLRGPVYLYVERVQ